MLKVYSLIIFLMVSFTSATICAQERLLVSYAGFGGFQAPAWAAQDLGLFTKYGLSTELVMISGVGPRNTGVIGWKHSLRTDRRNRLDLSYQSGSRSGADCGLA